MSDRSLTSKKVTPMRIANGIGWVVRGDGEEWAAMEPEYVAEIERLRAALKAAEAFFNVVCFRWPDAIEQVEEYAAPLRKALSGDSSQVETKATPVPALPMRMDQPWSLPEVLAKLIEATEHSLGAHGCDTHGHELFRAAANAGQSILREWQNTAQETKGHPEQIDDPRLLEKTTRDPET